MLKKKTPTLGLSSQFQNNSFHLSYLRLFLPLALDIISPEEKDSTHFGYYIGAAIANSSAMISSNMALRFVSYPMQVIFKSAKPIAVMAGGVLICKRYTIQRYFFVLMIVIGVIIFKLFESKDPKKSKKESMEVTQWEQYFGIGLLVLSLAMDGVLGAIQDRIRGVYAPTFRQMMLSMSAWVCVVTSGIVLVTGEFTKVFKFTVDHPNIIWHLLSFGIASTFGQLFIFTMVSCFGSLACSVTTTVRKFFSVVISIIIFQNPSTLLQWIGAVLVFAGLLFDAIFGKGRSKPDNQPTADTELGAVSENLLEKPKQDDAKPKNGEHQTQAQASV